VPPNVALVGNPVVAALIAALFLCGVLVQGLVIWDAPAAQAAALVAVLATVVAVIGAWRAGSFRARTVVELRREPEGDRGYLAVTARGRAVSPDVWLDGEQAATGPFRHFSRLREVVISLPGRASHEVHVWAHRLSPEGDSELIQLKVERDGERLVIRP
jgi:hypothetical protein